VFKEGGSANMRAISLSAFVAKFARWLRNSRVTSVGTAKATNRAMKGLTIWAKTV
jgi:hypothetical protein